MRGFALLILSTWLGAQALEEPARILVFEAVPGQARRGETVVLRWSARGTDQVSLEPPVQVLPSAGRISIILRERTVFWLHAANALGGQSLPLVVELLQDEAPARPTLRGEDTAVQDHPKPLASGSSGIWIQFAALAEFERVEKLQRELTRHLGVPVTVFELQQVGPPPRTLHRLRLGPFATLREARHRLQQLRPKLRSLDIKPFVAAD
jgi:hypothetical protein